MASRRTWLLFSNTHKERTIRVPRKMMPTLVTNKFMYNEAGARCIVPSFSRGLTLTAEGTSEASTSHEPVLPSAMLPHRCHFTPQRKQSSAQRRRLLPGARFRPASIVGAFCPSQQCRPAPGPSHHPRLLDRRLCRARGPPSPGFPRTWPPSSSRPLSRRPSSPL
mgnify:CR=1 FL=1